MDSSSPLDTFGTRQQLLLRLLKRSPEGLTVEQLVEKLGITRTAVNQHLQSLEDSQFITRGESTMTGGRPSQRYTLSTSGIELFPRRYSWFSSLLLQQVKEAEGPSKLLSMLEHVATSLAKSIANTIISTKTAERIAELKPLMNDLGYEVKIKNQKQGLPVIEAYNCIYHNLATEYPELCHFDRKLLSEATGAHVEQEACMVKGDACCRFRFTDVSKSKHN